MIVHLERTFDQPSERWYFSCPSCGWCGPLRATCAAADADVEPHLERKARSMARHMIEHGYDPEVADAVSDAEVGAVRLVHAHQPHPAEGPGGA